MGSNLLLDHDILDEHGFIRGVDVHQNDPLGSSLDLSRSSCTVLYRRSGRWTTATAQLLPRKTVEILIQGLAVNSRMYVT